MSNARVPENVVLWARSQSGEFTAVRLAAELELSRITASIYLSRLALAGKATRLMRGRYISYRPSIPSTLQRVGLAIAREMPSTDAVLWTTGAIAQFMHDMPTQGLVVVEAAVIDVDAIEDVLLAMGIPTVSRPAKRDIAEYMVRSTRVIVLPSRNRYATVPWKGHLRMAMLEKALVDVYFLASRKGLPFPPTDVIEAMRIAIERGAIDARVLKRYGSRRHILAELGPRLEV